MKRILTTLAISIITLIGYATPYTADNLPVSTQYLDSLDFSAVSNPDGILTAAEVHVLDSILWSLHEEQRVQGLVIAIKESDPDDPYEFAIQVARKYGVGGKNSTGFIMLVTTEQRGYQILTGDGMEKFLTDAQCSTIGRRVMVPSFKEGEWGTGLIAGLKVIDGICKGEVELNTAPDADGEDDGDLGTALLCIFGPIGALGGYAYYSSRKSRECPKCKKHNYRMVKRTVKKLSEDDDPEDKQVQVVDFYTCPDCNYATQRKYLSTTDKYYLGTFNGKGKLGWGLVAAAAASALGSRRRRGGGGFSGGSSSSGPSFHSTFGGGSFSGGGAGGRF